MLNAKKCLLFKHLQANGSHVSMADYPASESHLS